MEKIGGDFQFNSIDIHSPCTIYYINKSKYVGNIKLFEEFYVPNGEGIFYKKDGTKVNG